MEKTDSAPEYKSGILRLRNCASAPSIFLTVKIANSHNGSNLAHFSSLFVFPKEVH